MCYFAIQETTLFNLLLEKNQSLLYCLQFVRLPLLDRLSSLPLMAAGKVWSTAVWITSSNETNATFNILLQLQHLTSTAVCFILFHYVFLIPLICTFYLQLLTSTTLTLLGGNMIQVSICNIICGIIPLSDYLLVCYFWMIQRWTVWGFEHLI